MGIKCIDFVGYIETPLGSTGSMLFKAVYERRDPEVTTFKLDIYIGGELVFSKEYTASDQVNILEEFQVEWKWGCAKCPMYRGSFSAKAIGYGVIVAVGKGSIASVYTPSGECIASAQLGSVEGLVVVSDEASYIDASSGVFADCGGLLDESSVSATVVLTECATSCTATRYSLVLYAVCYSNVSPRAWVRSNPLVSVAM